MSFNYQNNKGDKKITALLAKQGVEIKTASEKTKKYKKQNFYCNKQDCD